jgi:hypothetical protein
MNTVGLEHLGRVRHIAQANVKVAVHALQGANQKAIFEGRDAKNVRAHFNLAGAGGEGSRDGDLLPGLSQTPHMHLDQLGQVRYHEVPFVG